MKVPARVPILTYHSLDASGSVVSVPPPAFREHVRHLLECGFTGVSLDGLIAAWGGRGELPQRPVVLTFDDAYANVLEYAIPVLREAGFSATLFAIAGASGTEYPGPRHAPGGPRLPLLDWAGLRAAVAAGFEVGSHTMTHRRLDQAPSGVITREIESSKRLLEDRLGVPVRSFAYPYGIHDARSVQAVRDAYAAGCTTRMGVARVGSDRHLLPRIDVYYLRDPTTFRMFGTAAGGVYLALRGTLRAARTAWRRR